MARKRSRKHPGVTLIKPDAKARTGWRARFKDPDSGKTKRVTLDPGLRTREQREDWCDRKSRALTRRRLALDEGATRATGLPIDAAVEHYFDGHPHLRPATLRLYRRVSDKFLRWAETARVHTVDDLNRGALVAFRETLLQESKHAQASFRTIPKGPRSPHTVNKELRATSAMLRYLCDLDLFARLTPDDLRRALRRIQAPIERPVYLRPKSIEKLLAAALRHDEERPPIGPFVTLMLLTGMRPGEALTLTWARVDLEAPGDDGLPAGELYVTAQSETHRGRVVDLDVSPGLRTLLATLRLGGGGRGRVFAHLDEYQAHKARRRLLTDYGAPEFTWLMLRKTCGSFLANAPGVFGGASVYRTARQLGHSVAVAEKHYLGVVKGIPRDARTAEAAMGVEAQVQQVIASIAKIEKRKVG